MTLIQRVTSIALLFTGGCAEVDEPDGHNHPNHGLITTLVLNVTPASGGETMSFEWSDPANDGNHTVDDVYLPDANDHDHHDAMVYNVSVELWNDLEDPAEDVTAEIEELAEEHQLFFTGSGVEGPATGTNAQAIVGHSYDDKDAEGRPLGLENTFVTTAWGTGELVVTLRHLPEEDGQLQKVSGMAKQVANNGFGAIAGDNDIQVTFPLEVE